MADPKASRELRNRHPKQPYIILIRALFKIKSPEAIPQDHPKRSSENINSLKYFQNRTHTELNRPRKNPPLLQARALPYIMSLNLPFNKNKHTLYQLTVSCVGVRKTPSRPRAVASPPAGGPRGSARLGRLTRLRRNLCLRRGKVKAVKAPLVASDGCYNPCPKSTNSL